MAGAGRRQGDRASASTGQPRRSAKRWTANGSPLPAPATITPRRPEISAASSRVSGGAARGADSARCQGAPSSRPGGRGPDTPTSGSRKARFRWTGPARPPAPSASATTREARERQLPEVAESGTPGSAAKATARPYRSACSMVWAAPTPWASGGRSAVTATRGTPAWWASMTAGCSSAAAVPLVVRTTAGRPVRMAMPRAKNPAERSSRKTWLVMRGSATRASASGVEREPGATTASVIPARAHSSTRVAQ